jgi:TonB family protein
VTGTEELFIQLGELRRHELWRLIAISFAAHVVVVVVFGFSPESKISVPRGVVSVELVRAPAAARPAAPGPAAKPAPPKPKPKPKKIVLPAEPTTPKIEPKVVEKAPPPVKPKPEPEKGYEDVMAQLRAQSGEDAPPTEVAKAEPAAIGTPGSPDGVAISPEVADWIKRVKIHIQTKWVVLPGFRTQDLGALVEFELDASGAVRGTPRVSRRSGNPWYDESVVSAIQKSSPLPAPPEAGRWSIRFDSWDSY